MIHKLIDVLFPTVGGFGGSLFMLEHIHPKIDCSSLLWMTFPQWCEAIIMIVIAGFIGGSVGWLVKRWLDRIFPKKQKK